MIVVQILNILSTIPPRGPVTEPTGKFASQSKLTRQAVPEGCRIAVVLRFHSQKRLYSLLSLAPPLPDTGTNACLSGGRFSVLGFGASLFLLFSYQPKKNDTTISPPKLKLFWWHKYHQIFNCRHHSGTPVFMNDFNIVYILYSGRFIVCFLALVFPQASLVNRQPRLRAAPPRSTGPRPPGRCAPRGRTPSFYSGLQRMTFLSPS